MVLTTDDLDSFHRDNEIQPPGACPPDPDPQTLMQRGLLRDQVEHRQYLVAAAAPERRQRDVHAGGQHHRRFDNGKGFRSGINEPVERRTIQRDHQTRIGAKLPGTHR